jgi:hypothetical protein
MQTTTRGDQDRYNALLAAFGPGSFHEQVDYLMSLGHSTSQSNNAVHVYRKGGATRATFRLTSDDRDRILDAFGGSQKSNKESVDHLRSHGCTYRQAQSAVYKYRQHRGLIGK